MTRRTAAARYARALLEVTVKEHTSDPQEIEQQLAGFVQLCQQYPALERVLVSPAIPAPRKRAVVEELAGRGRFAPVLRKLLGLLADRDRLVLMPDLLESYRERLLDHLKVVRAVVTTAAPLADQQRTAIEQRLAEVTRRRVILAASVDPAIIGGVVTRIGSTIYDGSVTGQLQRMKARFVEGT